MKEMADNTTKLPDCFGNLDTVFPVGSDGLRSSPPKCMKCPFATSCLKSAMQGPEGLRLQEEKVDQAYSHGLIGRLERWSRKKLIQQQIEALALKTKSKGIS